MKVFALLATTAAAALVSTSHAAECSPPQVTALKSSAEFKTMDTVKCDFAMVGASSCEMSACVKALKAVVKVLPDCTIDGWEPKAEYGVALLTAQRQCKKEGASSNPVYPECTDAQKTVITTDRKDEVAAHAACGTPDDTGPFAPSAKECEKPCVDAWVTMVTNAPKCTIADVLYGEELADAVTVRKNICDERAAASSGGASNSTASEIATATTMPTTTTALPTAATTAAPASTTAAPKATPAPTTSGSVTMGVSARAAAVLAAVVVAVQL